MDTETLNDMRAMIGRFVDDRLIPLEASVAETDMMPQSIVDEMCALGLFGMTVPSEFGGLGLSSRAEVELVFELGRASPAFRSTFGTNNGIGSQGIIMDGTEEQKHRFLPRIASGEIITSFCLTEPHAGSDAASLSTTAELVGDHYVLNGTKLYITNSPKAHLFTVMARTGGPGARGISAFLVERGTPGLSVGKPDKKMGQQGTHTADVVFEDCRVPISNLLGNQEGQGFKTAMKVLDRGRLHISAVCVGACERLIGQSLTYALERKQFGQRIADFQLIQAMLADSRAELLAIKALVCTTADRFDAGENVTLEASCCKMLASETVGRIADRAVQIHGGAGYIAEYGIERFYRDVRLFRLYEGTTQIQQIVIARRMIAQAEGH